MQRKSLVVEILVVLGITFGLLFLSQVVQHKQLKGILPPLAFLYPALAALLFQRADLAHYGLKWIFPSTRSMKILGWTILLVLIPYLGVYHVWNTEIHTRMLRLSEFPKLSLLGVSLFFQVLGVALPEEFFFRGYLQTRLQELEFFKGKSFYGPMLISNCFFAVSHLVGSPHAVRLLTFFPGLVFGWLWFRTQNLLIPILFHALCNVLLIILLAVYVP